MFGRNKRIKQEQQFEMLINYLLTDETVTPKEKEYIAIAKKQIEKDDYYPRILRNLIGRLQPLALKSQLSKHVGELYLRAIHDSYQDDGWNGISFMSF